MGNPFATGFVKHLEHDIQALYAFFALDGSSNVIGQAPTNAPVGTGPYSLCKGMGKALGIAGAVVTQPHTSTGLYTFSLDEPWQALIGVDLGFFDQGAVQQLTWSCRANVRSNTTGPRAGVDPGTETGLGVNQAVQIRFRTNIAGGALTDPAVSTGFWLALILKRTAIF